MPRWLCVKFDLAALEPKAADIFVRQNANELELFICDAAIVAHQSVGVVKIVSNNCVSFLLQAMDSDQPTPGATVVRSRHSFLPTAYGEFTIASAFNPDAYIA
jgi:hypothetical protein